MRDRYFFGDIITLLFYAFHALSLANFLNIFSLNSNILQEIKYLKPFSSLYAALVFYISIQKFGLKNLDFLYLFY